MEDITFAGETPAGLPRDFVWRFNGGRRSTSTSLSDFYGDMAVEEQLELVDADPSEADREACRGCHKLQGFEDGRQLIGK